MDLQFLHLFEQSESCLHSLSMLICNDALGASVFFGLTFTAFDWERAGEHLLAGHHPAEQR